MDEIAARFSGQETASLVDELARLLALGEEVGDLLSVFLVDRVDRQEIARGPLEHRPQRLQLVSDLVPRVKRLAEPHSEDVAA